MKDGYIEHDLTALQVRRIRENSNVSVSNQDGRSVAKAQRSLDHSISIVRKGCNKFLANYAPEKVLRYN